jgi:photosystem II stability/assembly factor-like uncharacterized protein
MNKFRFALYCATIISIITLTGTFLNHTIHPSEEEGNNPGYFQQWFNEKKNANGEIPRWMQAKWAAWDKSQVNRRSANIIDSVIELGPKAIGGRTRSIWIDPRNENIILAAAISGGIWRSTDAGTTWKPVNDQQTSLIASCLVSSPFDNDIIYCGTGESRANSADVSGNGIYKSKDGGITFDTIASTVGKTGFDNIWDIGHSLDDANTIFVATDNTGLHRSTNGGLTWQESFFGGNKKTTDLLVLPNNRIIVTLQSNGAYASDSAGKKGTFKALSFPGVSSYSRIQLASCRKYPDVVYALFENTSFSGTAVGFYKSSDAGRTWKAMSIPTAAGSGYQGYCVLLGAHTTDSNIVVAGGVNLAQSKDGGVTWTSKNIGHSDHHALATFISKPDEFLVGSDGGVYKHKFSSAGSPISLNNGYQVTQFYAGNFGPTGLVSMSGAQDNGTHVATNKLTSQKFYGADGAYAHIGLLDGSVAYFSTQNDGIRRWDNFIPTNTSGFSTAINDPAFTTDGVDFINAYAMNPADQAMLFYRTARGLYRSVDKGENWTKMNTTTRAGMKAIGVSNQSNPVVYIGGSSGQLYKFENAATCNQGTEVSYNSVVPISVTDDFIGGIAVHPGDKYTIYMSFSNNSNNPRVWRVSGMDSAKPVFKNISGNLPKGLPVNMMAVDPSFPDKNFFAATDFGFYYSTDSGKIWTKETKIPNVAVHEIKMRSDRTLFLYTHGRGMWAVTLTPTSGTTPVTKLPSVKVFPNPTSDYISVLWPEKNNTCNYRLVDLNGKIVMEDKISLGQNRISVQQYSAGYYFLQLTAGNQKYTTKIVITH